MKREILLIILFFLCLHLENIYCDNEPITCRDDKECGVINIYCYISKCVNNTCQNFFNSNSKSDYKCCSETADCIIDNDCFLPFCDVSFFTCTYLYLNSCEDNNNHNYNVTDYYDSNNDNNVTSYNDISTEYVPNKTYRAGDVIGAIIGFSILAILILAFVGVVIAIFVNHFVKNRKERKDYKNQIANSFKISEDNESTLGFPEE